MSLTGTIAIDGLLVIAFLMLMMIGYYAYLHTYWRRKNVPHCKENFLFFGSFYRITRFKICLGEFLKEQYDKIEGPVVGMYDFCSPCLMVKDPEMLKTVLVKDFANFSDRGFVHNSEIDPYGINNLLAAPVAKWKAMRHRLTPLFTSGKIKFSMDNMRPVGDDLVRYLHAHEGQVIETFNLFKKYAIEIFTKSAFGLKANCLEDDKDPILQAAETIWDYNTVRAAGISMYLFCPAAFVKLLRLQIIPPSVSKFWMKILGGVIKTREASQARWNDLLETMLDIKKNDPNLKDEEIMVHMLTFMAAGYESSNSSVIFTLYQLSHHPEMQDRLRKEVKAAMKQHGGLTYESLFEMPYLDMVLGEALRMYPPFPVVLRECKKKYTFNGTNITLHPGMKVICPVLPLHYDEKYYPNSRTFDPERFSKENKAKIPSGAYLPFGLGPRNCIGERFGRMFYKFTIIRILTEFDLVKAPGTTSDFEFSHLTFTVRSTNDFPVIFNKLEDSA